MALYRFDSSEAAGDAHKFDSSVKVGDVLVVESEEVVGVDALYPFAVTERRGSFSDFLIDSVVTKKEFVQLIQSVKEAVAEAQRLGFEVDPDFNYFKVE